MANNPNAEEKIKLLQWNILGFRAKLPLLTLALAEQRYDVVLLQETLLQTSITIPNYKGFHQFYSQGRSRGLIILVRRNIHAEPLQITASCGQEVESLAVTIALHNTKLQIYNIYRPPRLGATLKLDHLFAAVSSSPSIVGGDFNAHCPTWNNPLSSSASRLCRAGNYLNQMLQTFPATSLLNKHVSTHLRGGVLDLSFVSTSLLPLTTWSLHPYLASDHFASTITVDLPRLQRCAPEPRWNFRRADWHEFSYLMEEWAETHVPAHDLEDQEKEIVAALHQAANQAIPKVGTSVFTHKNGWFYNDRVRELKHRLIVLKKKLKQHFSPSLLETYQAAHRLICKEIQEIRTNSWLKWCESLNAHTSLHDLWTKLNRVSGKHKKQPSHPQPLQIANDLIQSFQARSSNTQLPRSTLNRTQNLSHHRELSIHTAIALPSDLDVPFTLHEIKKVIQTSKDTAPGIDKISYSMLNHLGDHALMQITNLFTASLTSGRLPSQWKEANIHPIPKNTTPPSYRPISLLSCLSKTMERAILARLKHKVPHPDKNIFAYCKGLGTKDNLAAIHSTLDGKDGLAVFLDLEKAFELARREVIVHILTSRGISGKILSWTNDYLLHRKARVRFQEHYSVFKVFENGTPQGGILSPFLFNLLIAELLAIQLPPATHLFAYADDLQLIATGASRFPHAQQALDLITRKCHTLGLKLNSNKTNALQIRRFIPNHHLYIETNKIEWVTSHKCLGIILNTQNDSSQLKNLDKTKARINVLRRLTTTRLGAGFHVLRSFYVNAIRSLIDYSSFSLLSLTPAQVNKLETIQNKCMRIILGAPRWTRLVNLRLEAKLVPLHIRMQQIVAGHVCKIVSNHRQSPLGDSLRRILDTPQAPHRRVLPWHHEIHQSVTSFNLLPALLSRGIDAPHHGFGKIPLILVWCGHKLLLLCEVSMSGTSLKLWGLM